MEDLGAGGLTAVKIDGKTGDIYVGGESPAFTFESASIPKGEFILSLDKQGHLRWSKPLGNAPSGLANSLLAPTSIVLGKDGALYVAGQFTLPIDFGDGSIAPPTMTSGYVARVRASDGHGSSASSGDYWTLVFGNLVPSVSQPRVGVFSSGYVGFAATVAGGTTLGGTSLPGNGGHDILVGSVDNRGSAPNASLLGDAADQDLSAMEVSPFGSVNLGGTFKGTITLRGGADSITASNPAGEAFYLQVDIAHNYRWGAALGAPGAVTSLGSDSDGNLRMAAWTSGPTKMGGETFDAMSGALLIANLNTSGHVLWQRHYAVELSPLAIVGAAPDGSMRLGGTASKSIDLGTGGLVADLDAGEGFLARFAK